MMMQAPNTMGSPNQVPLWKMAQQGNGMDPKQQIMMAMLQQQLAKAGGQLAGGGGAPMQQPGLMVPGFDLYGNPQG